MTRYIDVGVDASAARENEIIRRRQEVDAMRRQVVELMTSISKERDLAASEQRTQLAEYYDNLSVSVKKAMDDITEAQKKMVEDQNQMADDLSAKLTAYHDNLVASVRKSIDEFTATRKLLARDQGNRISAYHNDLVTSVKKMVEGFATSRQQMAAEQSENLMRFCGELVSETALLRTEVEEMLEAMRVEQQDRRNAVTRLVAGMQESDAEPLVSAGAVENGEAEVEAADVSSPVLPPTDAHNPESGMDEEEEHNVNEAVDNADEAIEEVDASSAREESEEVAENAVETSEETTEESEDLYNRILELLMSHPEGLRVSDMEDPLNEYRTRIGVAAKQLLQDKKVYKEGGRYFPIES